MSVIRRAERRALQLLKELEIESPPVKVDEIALALGVKLSYRPFEGSMSGMLFRDARKKVIGVNSRHHRNRKRFTIAHELGHLLLHRGRPLIVDRDLRINLRDDISGLALDSEEIEANRFAAELLMPRYMVLEEFEKHLRRRKPNKDITRELAKAFGVSLQAMEYRLVNLGVRSFAS